MKEQKFNIPLPELTSFNNLEWPDNLETAKESIKEIVKQADLEYDHTGEILIDILNNTILIPKPKFKTGDLVYDEADNQVKIIAGVHGFNYNIDPNTMEVSEEMSWKYRINYFQHEKNLIPINDIIAE